jgi:TolA-binding protein
MKKMVLKIAVAFVILGSFCYSLEIPEELYLKAETLYNSIPNKTQSITNIPKYKEITDILEQITEKEQTAGTELLQKTYQMMINSYDKQARYTGKHNAMKQFAALKYPEDKEQQAQWLKQQADKLMEEGETAEAITLYRMIAREYPETETAPESLFIIAEIIEKVENKQMAVTQTIKEYETLIKQYPKTEYAAESCLLLTKQYQLNKEHNKAIESLNFFLKEYPENKKYENALFHLGLLYHQNKKEVEAKKIWQEYLKKYPGGIYSGVVKTFIGGDGE